MTSARRRSLVLLTNDDGYLAPGLAALARALRRDADLWLVAPDRERSATSLALTLVHPLRVLRVRRQVWAVDGTPADCVYLAVRKLLPRVPDLLLSGINRGPNIGRQDVSYSGTVAAALQGAFLGIPSVAFSALPDGGGRYHFEAAAGVAARLALEVMDAPWPEGAALNVNFPPPPWHGLRLTTLGDKHYEPEIIEKVDPRSRAYFWIGLGRTRLVGKPSSDIQAVGKGFISVTPLRPDPTDRPALRTPLLRRLRALSLKPGGKA